MDQCVSTFNFATSLVVHSFVASLDLRPLVLTFVWYVFPAEPVCDGEGVECLILHTGPKE